MGTGEEWGALLTQRLGRRVEVVFGRSRSYPVQARSVRQAEGPALAVRLHAMFAAAPPQVAEALATWLRSGRRAPRAAALLDRWIHDRLRELPLDRAARKLDPRGQHHDLAALARPLLAQDFAADFCAQRPPPGLTWGARRRSLSRRSLRLGSYDLETDVVRLHPVLDQPAVPPWFVSFILMHEILHAALPPRPSPAGRLLHHGPEFRAREAGYADYQRALRWEHDNLPRLIACARRGTPMRVRRADRAPRPRPVAVVLRQGDLFAQ